MLAPFSPISFGLSNAAEEGQGNMLKVAQDVKLWPYDSTVSGLKISYFNSLSCLNIYCYDKLIVMSILFTV
jgi:hypothetical protein